MTWFYCLPVTDVSDINFCDGDGVAHLFEGVEMVLAVEREFCWSLPVGPYISKSLVVGQVGGAKRLGVLGLSNLRHRSINEAEGIRSVSGASMVRVASKTHH